VDGGAGRVKTPETQELVDTISASSQQMSDGNPPQLIPEEKDEQTPAEAGEKTNRSKEKE